MPRGYTPARAPALRIVVFVQSLSHVRLFATPWTAAHLASLSLIVSRSLPKFMFIELVMPSIRLTLCPAAGKD